MTEFACSLCVERPVLRTDLAIWQHFEREHPDVLLEAEIAELLEGEAR